MPCAMKKLDRLAQIRHRIDVVDRRVARLLARRLKLVKSLKPLKTRVRDRARERAVIANVLREAGSSPADKTFIRSVYRALLAASRRRQR